MKQDRNPKKENHDRIKLAPFIFNVRRFSFIKAANMNFGHHLSGKQKGYTNINKEGNIYKIGVAFVGVRCVETNRNQRNKSTDSKTSSNPCFVDPFNVNTFIECFFRPVIG